MDNDHICGLIQCLKEAKSNLIENVWYNGFLQMVNSRFYQQKENPFLPEEDQNCPVCGTQMILIGEEYVRRELEFISATYIMVEMAKTHELNIYGYLKFLLKQRPDKDMTDEQLADLALWSEKIQSIKNRM